MRNRLLISGYNRRRWPIIAVTFIWLRQIPLLKYEYRLVFRAGVVRLLLLSRKRSASTTLTATNYVTARTLTKSGS